MSLDTELNNGFVYVQVKQVHIDYARNAKHLDVKKLKTKMWEIIAEDAEDMKENMVYKCIVVFAILHLL